MGSGAPVEEGEDPFIDENLPCEGESAAMAYEVEEPTEETCVLKETDPSGATWVVVKEARSGEIARRDALWSEFAIERDEHGEIKLEHYKVPGTRATFVDCYLTFVDSNIDYKHRKRDANGRPVLGTDGSPVMVTEKMFKAGMSQSEFEARFAKLPSQMMREWHDHVLRLNPDWNPGAKKEIAKN